MWVDAYDIGPIRPPSEAESLLIRVNRNCPWNRCEFCTVYKDTRFERKSVGEVCGDIDRAAAFFGARGASIRTAFLQDANALLMPTDSLVHILEYLRQKFPGIERVTSYARASTVARKSADELAQLCDAGLKRLHLGLESGSAAVLKFMNKGVTPDQHIAAGVKVREAGISLSEYVMPGLGGRRWSREHAEETARVLNAVNPDFIRLRSFIVRPDSPVFAKQQRGEFEPLTEEEKVREIRLMVERLDGITSTLVSDHLMNLLQELEGRLPEAKPDILAAIDRYLALTPEQKENFMVGARLRIYQTLDDMNHPARRAQTDDAIRRIRAEIQSNPTISNLTLEGCIAKMMEAVV